MNSRSVRRSISWGSLSAKSTMVAPFSGVPSPRPSPRGEGVRERTGTHTLSLLARLRAEARAELLLIEKLLDAAVAAALGVAADELGVLGAQVVPGLVV